MIEKLYYTDPYRKQFCAKVIARRQNNGKIEVMLDATAFYATCGGQPNDTGYLNDSKVIDVNEDEEGIWHTIEGDLPIGTECIGIIDWERRFDGMQQHGGQHLLSWAISEQLGGHTIGLHTGAEFSTIDVVLKHIPSDTQVKAIEEAVQKAIMQDLPIKCWFPTEEELASLPLRKQPTVTENIRIVASGNIEYAPCGGVHPSSTGQIGIFKVIGVHPSRGKVRFSFLCGMRAFKDYQAMHDEVAKARALLSAQAGGLPSSIENMLERNTKLAYEVEVMQKNNAILIADRALESASVCGQYKIAMVGCKDTSVSLVKEMAMWLAGHENICALVQAKNDVNTLLAFSASAGIPIDMGRLLKKHVTANGGKGGGRAELAQGSAPNPIDLRVVADEIAEILKIGEKS